MKKINYNELLIKEVLLRENMSLLIASKLLKLSVKVCKRFAVKFNISDVINNHICEYCFNNFETGLILGAHKILCKNNPNRIATIEKSRNSKIGKILSIETKQKLSKTISNKINHGQWHYSFSKSRTHEYKGIKLHGKWEVKYAEWLDQNLINWIRPKNTFSYNWKNKNRKYTPDFYLPDYDLYIEVKGYETSRDRAKWKQFEGNKLRIFSGSDLNNLGINLSYRIIKKK